MKTRSDTVDTTNVDDFPPLSAPKPPKSKRSNNQKPTSTSKPPNETEASSSAGGKKSRPNGTTPKKQGGGVPSVPTIPKNKEIAPRMAETGNAKGKGPTPPTKSPTIDLPSPNEDTPNDKDNISPAANALARNLDKALMNAEKNVATIHPGLLNPTKNHQTPTTSHQETKALTFSVGTSFTNATVDSQVKRTPRPIPIITKPTQNKTPLYKATLASLPIAPLAKPSKQIKAFAFTDPGPQGIAPKPVAHNFTFVARVAISVPNCSSFQYKVMNLLAYAMNILRQYDPQAAYLNIKDPKLQAATIQELPKITDFLKHWSYFEHTIEEFKHFILEPGKTKRYRGSVLIGCNIEPKQLLSDSCLDLDRELDASIGGGKITLDYKQMQVVDTDRNWILFGVPSETHPESFGNLLRPFLQHSMHKMRDKNPTKYTASKYAGAIPEFIINIMYANVPYKMSEGLPGHAKLCIHIETRQSDLELFKELFRFISLAKLEKKMFGQFAHFYRAPSPGAPLSEREKCGEMLQSHVAVMRSLGKVALPGIMFPDKIMACQMKDDDEGEKRDTVDISLRRIMMKQRIGRPKVWQCILPNSGGGWDGFYANGLGCGDHRVQALNWAVCVPAHLRFHLLRKGVSVESTTEFINQVFTCEAASEAFNAKLINGEVYTFNSASAASMRNDIMTSGWIDLTLGLNSSSVTNTSKTLSRPNIVLRENGDLSAHNFHTDRNPPPISDTASVAYSTSGETTLGDGEYENPDDDPNITFVEHKTEDDKSSSGETTLGDGDYMNLEDDPNVKNVEQKAEDDKSIYTLDGSTESEMWNPTHKKETQVITNIDMVLEKGETGNTNEPQAIKSSEEQLEDLLRQIQILQATNTELMAAVNANNTASTMGSHPTLQQPEKAGAADKEGGGMH